LTSIRLKFFSLMTGHMQATVLRLAPLVAKWLAALKER
jgi:hypothetical protein